MSGAAVSADMDSAVKPVFESLAKDAAAQLVIKSANRTEHYTVTKSDSKPVNIVDNGLTFDTAKLEIHMQTNKSHLKLQSGKLPIELALQTSAGRAYVKTTDGQQFKTYSEGNVKISKAAKGNIELKSAGSGVCVII